jgi:DNA replication protein DnaC
LPPVIPPRFVKGHEGGDFFAQRKNTTRPLTKFRRYDTIGNRGLRKLKEVKTMEDLLLSVCKKLHFTENFAKNAKKIKAKTHVDFLIQLFNFEIEERDRKRRNNYLKAAKFDILKTFENYSFEDIKFPNSLTADDIFDCSFIPKRENLILYGNVGAGKTHLAIATGIAACNAGFKVRYWSTPRLVNFLIDAKKKGEILDFMRRFDKLDLLICDEWGYVPIDSVGSKLLFQLVSECYERKSVIITTNLEFARWNDIFADTKITAALLDRVIHHSHLLDFTNRDSRRLIDAVNNKLSPV